jgi:hypothetical protein
MLTQRGKQMADFRVMYHSNYNGCTLYPENPSLIITYAQATAIEDDICTELAEFCDEEDGCYVGNVERIPQVCNDQVRRIFPNATVDVVIDEIST